ncbi:MAG: hypothetical protein ACOX0Y_12400 [Thiopseudomonas sp.]
MFILFSFLIRMSHATAAKKAVPNLFCVFPGFVKQLATAFHPVDNIEKSPADSGLQQLCFCQKDSEKG